MLTICETDSGVKQILSSQGLVHAGIASASVLVQD